MKSLDFSSRDAPNNWQETLSGSGLQGYRSRASCNLNVLLSTSPQAQIIHSNTVTQKLQVYCFHSHNSKNLAPWKVLQGISGLLQRSLMNVFKQALHMLLFPLGLCSCSPDYRDNCCICWALTLSTSSIPAKEYWLALGTVSYCSKHQQSPVPLLALMMAHMEVFSPFPGL